MMILFVLERYLIKTLAGTLHILIKILAGIYPDLNLCRDTYYLIRILSGKSNILI